VPVQSTSASGVAGHSLRRTRKRTSGTRAVGVAPEAAPCYARFLDRQGADRFGAK
jgi:hypothetical protein